MNHEESILKFKEICNDKKIIVVGNSEFKNKHGSLIDSYDVVIKFNHGAVFGQDKPEYFGKKCTIWNYAMNDERVCYNKYKEFKEKPDHIIRWGHVKHPNLQFSLTMSVNYNISNELNIAKHKYPSSGIVMIHYIANNIQYKELSIVGFDSFKTVNFYEKNKKNRAIRWHESNKESDYINKLVRENKLFRR